MEFLTKSEISFWLVIIGIIVSVVLVFSTLKGDVKALSEDSYEKDEYLLIRVNKLVKDVRLTRESQIRLETHFGILNK